jgi:predicted HTH transcriptional regulator
MLSVSDRTIERDLARLTEEGSVEYVGSSKGGEWKVKNK